MVNIGLSPALLSALPVVLPHALVVFPTIWQTLQYTRLAATTRQKLAPALLALLSAPNHIYPPFIGGEHAAAPDTNWGAWLHFSFTGLHFTLYMLISAWLSGKKLWMFIGLSAYQISLVSAQVQSAYKGFEAITMKGVKNPAFDPLDPSWGPEWLEPIASPLHATPMTSVLDSNELKNAGRYFAKHWYMTLVTDGALIVISYLLLSSLKASGTDAADTFLANALSNATPLLASYASQWPSSLTIPFITPAATPFFLSYVRPRTALLALVLGVQVRSMIISHIEGADKSEKEGTEKQGQVEKKGKTGKK
ncbi:hypothetical protein BCR35DRAFT_303350 [Leucosporidium creatinivorum]|uniref:Uncharacterized protein n=1 Tax=Leucosporidium creatinivorum TaxID=106004 RepID=A0A1Y2FHR1_9BASI|nr:hypothetical protein BCR35DRAFT_303350 [Leucosporidium creatinivorum]